MAPLLDRCGELGMPVSVHVADPIWMYQKMDETNDGMMNAVKWRLDDKPGIVDHAGMIDVLERAVRAPPANDLHRLSTSPTSTTTSRASGSCSIASPTSTPTSRPATPRRPSIPRFAAQFITRYQDRLVYGTDMGRDPEMYRLTFRILETLDEHFYAPRLRVPLELLRASVSTRRC